VTLTARGWRLLYTLLFYLALPFLLLRLAFLGFRHRGYWRRLPERFGFARRSPSGARTIWIHAVSVGEFLAALPLITALRSRYFNPRILITTVTPTGADMVRQKLGDAADHAYLPFDVPDAVDRFLTRVRPVLCLLMETELWPNLLAACGGQRVPVVLVNARLSEKSARGYARLASLTRAMLSAVTVIAAQTEGDAARLRAQGAGRIVVTGNLKYDQPLDSEAIKLGREWREKNAAARPVWIAASTHAGEEEIILAAHERIRARYPDCLLILVPRHPDRGAAVTVLAERRGFRARRHGRSAAAAVWDVYVVDVLGRLIMFYAASDIAFVGGSLMRVGGHNLLEPAALGLPVLCGPHAFNFSGARHLLEEAGGLQVVADAGELARAVTGLFGDSSARQSRGRAASEVVAANRGATDRIMRIICGMNAI